jgi:hypothetical protein
MWGKWGKAANMNTELWTKFEAELIRLNQAADLAERVFTEGAPEEYVIDGMVMHIRTLTKMYYGMRKTLP